MSSTLEAMTTLGRKVEIPSDPESATIDIVPAPKQEQAGGRYTVRLSCPEFTSLCPVTGQPDFAHIVIDYVPNAFLIESKGLKLFLSSFRNYGAFHEVCTVLIGSRLSQAAKPMWMSVSSFWFPRGGIPIDVFWQTGEQPARVKLPPIDIQTYRAR